MTETQEMILNGTINMYQTSGEMVPVILFNHGDLKALSDLNKIKILDSPYGMSDDFFGLVGCKYPKTFNDLMKYRQIRDEYDDQEKAREQCECIEL